MGREREIEKVRKRKQERLIKNEAKKEGEGDVGPVHACIHFMLRRMSAHATGQGMQQKK